MVVGLVLFSDPQSYTGGSIATGRASHLMQVGSEKPDEISNRKLCRKYTCFLGSEK